MTAYEIENSQKSRKTLVIRAKSVRIVEDGGLEISIEGSKIPWKEIIVNGNVYAWKGRRHD